jgi:hypothetical protein
MAEDERYFTGGKTLPWVQTLEDYIVFLFTARGALTGLVFFLASLMAGASFLKSVCIFLLTAWLHAWGYGSRILELMAMLAVVCAAVFWIDVIPFDHLIACVSAKF